MRRTLIVLALFCANLLVHGQYISPGTGICWTLTDLVQYSTGAVTIYSV
ncbi:MAG: hypothetical protein U1C46_03585 [Bacteroidales bacterium]|nr:hypothetical protein [Bacteroidales bacterium]MDZ4203882.1 hypothetical protein [Bacteroidales bacterium]